MPRSGLSIGAPRGVDFWNTGDTICRPDASAGQGSAQTCTTQLLHYIGGPGMIVRAGRTVRGICFNSSAASTNLTNCWAALLIPDETGALTMTVVATSQDFTTTTWAATSERKFSLAVGDGGSGIWTPSVDTPVFFGLCQNGSGLATVRGMLGAGGNTVPGTPKWWGTASGTFTTPPSLAAVLTQNVGNAALVTCRASDVLP